MKHLMSLLVVFAASAFVLAPFVTPHFQGFDPYSFPVVIERPSVQPAGYAFSVWGLIYLWLLAHALFGLFRRTDDEAWQSTRAPLFGSLTVGVTWLWLAGWSPILATVVIWLMLTGALIAYRAAPMQQDRWLLSVPLSIFAGWLTAASCVSLGVLIAGHGILPDQIAAIVMIVLASLITLSSLRAKRGDPIHAAIVAWALIAITVANGTERPLVSSVALVALAVVVVAAFRWRKRA